MQVLKVVVDELPDSCTACEMSGRSDETGVVWFHCAALNVSMPIEVAATERPEWCPLILEGNVQDWIMTRPTKLIQCKESEE